MGGPPELRATHPRAAEMADSRRLLFAVLPLIALVGAGELGARIVGAPACEPIVPQATGWETMEGDPTLLWRLEPNRVYASPAGTTSTNAVGLRTALLPTDAKTPREKRVMVTGDSSVFGWGQPDGQTYAEQLERALDATFPSVRIRVVNLGVPGYSTEQTLKLLDALGWSYAPDLLVVHNIFSDCNIDAFQDRAAMRLADPSGTQIRRLLHASRLYCAAYMPWARYQAGLNQETARVLMPGQPVGANKAARLEVIDQVVDLSRVPLGDYLDNLDRIHSEATGHGARMLLAPLAQEWDVGIWTAATARPTEGQVLPWFPYRTAQAAWAQEHGIPRVDLAQAFAADRGDRNRLFIDHMHPSTAGATVMVRAILAMIRDQPELLGLSAADLGPPVQIQEPPPPRGGRPQGPDPRQRGG